MLLEATAKGSFGARMPRNQPSAMLQSGIMRGAGGHLHADPGAHRGRTHPGPVPHPKPIATGAPALIPTSAQATLQQSFPEGFGCTQLKDIVVRLPRPFALDLEQSARLGKWGSTASIEYQYGE